MRGTSSLAVREDRSLDFLLLVPTVACGVLGTLAVRASKGLRRLVPTALAVALYVGATVGLAHLVETEPVGVIYAVWAGLASVTLLVVDRFVFKEPVHARQALGVAIIVAGVILIDLQVGS